MIEKSMDVQFFVVDLDRTLDGEHEECRVALASLRQDSLLRTALATAHGAWTPKALAVGDYYDLDYLILENGSVILEKTDDGWLELSLWNDLYANAYIEAARFRDELFRRAQVEDVVSSMIPRPPFFRRTITLPDTGSAVELQEMSKVLILKACDPETFPELRQLVVSISRQLTGEVVLVWDETAVTVGIADKGNALVFLAEYKVKQRLRTAAMGDSFNDLGMLSLCDIPCAPANACEQVKMLVKQRGGIVADLERWKGVAEVLQQIRITR